MRTRSDNPDRQLSRRIREEQLHRLETGPIQCAFYMGRLADGTLSPGYVPSVPPDNRPGVYVVEAHLLPAASRADGIVRSMGFSTMNEEIAWARDNVKLLFVDHLGLPSDQILKSYVVYIACPLRNAVMGYLVPKKGNAVPYAAVPDGTDQDMQALLKMASTSTKLLDAVRLARGRYGTMARPTTGVPLNPGRVQFPADGQRWSK